MWLNILIAVSIGVLTYGATLYIDHHSMPDEPVEKEIQADGLKIDSIVPDFSFTATDGKTRKLSDFKDRIVILNFWASWCAPCVVEFPALINVAASYDKKEVVLIALSSDHDPAAMDRFLQKLDEQKGIDLGLANLLIALDKENAITQGVFQTFRLPETFIIDGNQKLRQKIIGANWEPDDLQAAIKEIRQ